MQTRKTSTSLEKYKKLRRIEKQIHKGKKREHNDKTFEQLEKLHSQHEVRKFYQTINKGRKEFKPRTYMV